MNKPLQKKESLNEYDELAPEGILLQIEIEFANTITFTLKCILHEYTFFILEQLVGLRARGSPINSNTLNLLSIPEKTTTKDSSLKSATFIRTDFRGFYFFCKSIFSL